jgi:hypothetical protein
MRIAGLKLGMSNWTAIILSKFIKKLSSDVDTWRFGG